MSKHLVIVESPAKSRSIERYLGDDYTVMASFGHVRDLVPKNGAVDPDKSFAMAYQVIKENERHVDAIRKALAKADDLILATDPDREGEAISWHIMELLKEDGSLGEKPVRRVVFNEVTPRAVREAMDNPRDLSLDLINAQQARRALDYLVGFNLSPLLWKKVKQGLSAGRVQSPALRMIAEREAEIEAFEPREFWVIEAACKKDKHAFKAKLARHDGKKVSRYDLNNETLAHGVRQSLVDAAQSQLTVDAVTHKERRRNPSPPFTTSTLQQEAVRKLGFSASRTMRVAQQLYEGIDLGSGPVGLITYMRTDSVNLAQEALADIRELIDKRFGKEMLPDKPRVYKTKAKNAQEAHEAVRPTSAMLTPDDVKASLSRDQFRLYKLVWKRAVASQMKHAVLDTVTVDLSAGNTGNLFKARGSTVREQGFMAVYREGRDDGKEEKDEHRLPIMDKGDLISLIEITATQRFTEPPPRYTEATLVKTLEERGIGRPSTYAAIISTLLKREYTELVKRHFMPTEMGRIVNGFLTNRFSRYVDYDFTANLEDRLDEISRGEEDWLGVLKEFWTPFHEQVADATANVTREEVVPARELGSDPKTGKPVTVRMGRFGPYLQFGDRDGDEKPRNVSLPPGQNMTSITLDEALDLLKLPRNLGQTPEGDDVMANIGRYGPYLKFGKQNISLREDDPFTITLERALELRKDAAEAAAKREIKLFEGSEIKVLQGRYGPYVTNSKKNARIPKKKDPASLTLEECTQLLEKAPDRKRRGGGRRRKSTRSAGSK